MVYSLNFDLWYHMKRIRMVEEEIAARYPEGEMRCPTHLSIGQEAVPAAVACLLEKGDLAVSTHRGHAHYLGKGGNLPAMMAEIYGKKTGCSQGKGGSMHLIDLSVGFMGTSPIVGNSIPIGVGLGLSLKIKKSPHLACVFLGDGSTEEGAFYEAMNFAVLKKLPVLFLCENNLYSVYSPLSVRQPENRPITNMVAAMGCPSKSVNGNNALETHAAIQAATSHIRNGQGPYFLEFSTYRWREHCGPNYDNDIGYRTEAEFEAWKQKDPIVPLENELIRTDAQKIHEAVLNIQHEINAAFEFAKNSPFPETHEAYEGEYA